MGAGELVGAAVGAGELVGAAVGAGELVGAAVGAAVVGTGGGGAIPGGSGGGGGKSSSMKCALTSSRLPAATVTVSVHVASTVGARSAGVHVWVRWLQVPGRRSPLTFFTSTPSTSAPE